MNKKRGDKMNFNLKEEIVLFIGHNNTTKKLETKKIISIISKYFKGFSCETIIGLWEGSQEKTLKVSIIEDSINRKALSVMANELKTSLKQDAILIKEAVVSSVFY